MRRSNIFLVLPLLMLPLAVTAAELLKPGATEAPVKRFFPLGTARQGAGDARGGIPLTRAKTPMPLRSDQQQMHQGFLRIDRARSVAIPSQHALPTQAAGVKVASLPVTAAMDTAAQMPEDTDIESEEIIGNREAIDPVLVLFDSEGSGALPSFRDVMRGHAGGAGGARHPFWPVPLTARQYVSSGYGLRADPFHGRRTFHGGIDIAADEGTSVLASAEGRVMQVANDPRYGRYVTLQHADGTLSRYGHLSRQTVREGQHVRGGQVIGAVGATGRATGAHLDYRVSRNNTKFDPLAILTVPAGVAFKGAASAPVAGNVSRAPRVASNALPRRPMVIQVR